MSDTSTEPTSSKKQRRKTSKYDKQKLPTPPPDPRQQNEQKEANDNEVFEYLESVLSDYAKGTSLFAPVIATDEAFDHLEKLYKLMEQMLELKEQNMRLHRKIRELEYLNALEKIQRDMDASGIDKPYLPESVAEHSYMAESGKKECKSKILTPTRLRPSILRKYSPRLNTRVAYNQSQSDCFIRQDGCGSMEKTAKISKWTKVKAAFKWEKASTSVSECKPQGKGIHMPVNAEIAQYLKVPSIGDDTSPLDSGAAGANSPGSLSTASSNEDVLRIDSKSPNEDSRSLDDETLQTSYIPYSKEDYSTKSHMSKQSRTPWAKMKEIIHTRNSFKKKHRLSAASDDIQIDVELCTDSEDNVFDDDASRAAYLSSSSSPNRSPVQTKSNSYEIPKEIVKKYQKAIEESGDKKKSRWAMVKKAFLSGDNSSTIQSSVKDNADPDREIQENYRKLQKKLSLEFQEKMVEWERLKQNSPSASNATTSFNFEDSKDPNFIRKMEEWEKIKHQPAPKSPLPSEFDLPPYFKKKLQEWEKIKKSSGTQRKRLGDVPKWKSLSGQRSDATFEYPPLSEDFIRKLKEWKQIKATRALEAKKFVEKTPSPKLVRKNSSPKYMKKYKDQDKDLHWVDREINKLEKEKQNLEKEMQKFIEKEERLTRLKRSAIGGDKKEVLIQTPSGFHRFEGISRKFTRKLYEWEKAQGIAPEVSTFALLTSSMKPAIRPILKRHSTCNISSLARSKSADSIAVSALNLTCPLLSQQPSSLSLNDMTELDDDFIGSKSSSMQYLEDDDDEEPQAVLVEVEDYEEETAAPLNCVFEKQQLPVYQRQEFKTLCAGETIATPKVRRSESTRAQTNYNLIEEVINILRHLAENEIEIKNIIQNMIKSQRVNENNQKLQEIFLAQRKLSQRTSDKLLKLQGANSLVISSISKEGNYTQAKLSENLEGVQDISNEVILMADKMDQNIRSRTIENLRLSHMGYISLFENIRDIRTKILELRRHLSYVCAATDTTVPLTKSKIKLQVQKTISNESKSSKCDTSDNSVASSYKDGKHFTKSERSGSRSNQCAVKKRIKFRQKTMMNKTLAAESDDDEDGDETKNTRQHRKITRTRSISDGGVDYKSSVERAENSNMERMIVTTEKNYLNCPPDNGIPETPLTVFVKTTRKLFTPIGETSFHNDNDTKKIEDANNCTTSVAALQENNHITNSPGTQSQCQLPSSPTPQRKILKDISPSIKLMLAKYNQKLSEQDTKSIKSGNSSGSSSPLWRSPISERRVKAQTEKYQEELNKLSPLLWDRKEVQKSASVGYIHSGSKQVTVPVKEDLTKTSSNTITPITTNTAKKQLTLDIIGHSPSNTRLSPEMRQKKIQKAKEEFLLSTPVYSPVSLDESTLTFPTRNRLSQISMDSGSSYDNALPGGLIKSASSGMINIDAEVYRQIDTDLPNRGYVSLPRNVTTQKSSKFGLSNLASRFRKVKMRKGKDKDKMNTVSTLCRQSLIVDITNSGNSRECMREGDNK